MSQNLIITISRQYGSGGRETGVILSKQMDIRCMTASCKPLPPPEAVLI